MNTLITLIAAGAFALGSTTATAGDQATAKQPEFKPLAGAASLKRGESLKPAQGQPEAPPIITQTRLLVNEDGSVEQVCEVHTGEQAHSHTSDAADPAEQETR